MSQEIFHPDLDEVPLETVLQALGDDIRISIVRELLASSEPMVCGSIDLPISKATRSHHFKILREAGITNTELIGTQRLVTVRRDQLDARFPGLLDAIFAATPATS